MAKERFRMVTPGWELPFPPFTSPKVFHMFTPLHDETISDVSSSQLVVVVVVVVVVAVAFLEKLHRLTREV